MADGGSAGMGWLFTALAAVLACVWAAPGGRRTFRWGRTASSVPMSGLGVAAWIGAFLLAAAASFGLLPLAVIFGIVPALAVAGCIDSHRAAVRFRSPRNRVP